MSLEKKSVHIRISHDQHQQLQIMAEFNHKADSELGELLLEKMIVAEFHDFRVTAGRMARLGITGIEGDE